MKEALPWISLSLLIQLASTPVFGGSNNQEYFPKGVNEYCRDWFRTQLIGMAEPNLFKGSLMPDTTTYRFLWLRSFHNQISVRVVHSGKGNKLVAVVLEPQGVDDNGKSLVGKLISRQEMKLTDEKLRELEEKFTASGFWQAPIEEKKLGGNDGAQWCFEARSAKNGYHCVSRWCPEGKFRELGLKFLQLGQLTPKDFQDIY